MAIPDDASRTSSSISRPILALGFARMADAVANSFLVVVLLLFIAHLGSVGAPLRPLPLGGHRRHPGHLRRGKRLLQLFTGRISDRAGQRKLFVIGGLLAVGVLNLLYLLADGTIDVLIIRATQGLTVAFTVTASIEPDVNQHLGQDARWFGIQFGVFILSVAGVQPIVGKLSDRWGRKGFVFWGLLLLAPTRLVQGQSGFQLSILTMSFGLGLSAGQLVAGFLIGYGYVVPFAFGAVLAVLASGMVRTEVVEAEG